MSSHHTGDGCGVYEEVQANHAQHHSVDSIPPSPATLGLTLLETFGLRHRSMCRQCRYTSTNNNMYRDEASRGALCQSWCSECCPGWGILGVWGRGPQR